MAPRGSCVKGSSIITPIFSTPSMQKAMRAVVGTVSHPQTGHKLMGSRVSQMT